MIGFELLIVVPAFLMAAVLCFPNRFANTNVRMFRRLVTIVAAVQFVISAGLAIALACGAMAPEKWTMISFTADDAIAISFLYDGVSSLMLALVSFVGWVITAYSIRYLDGEATQGRYFRWTGFAIGSVSLMVLSGNLLMFLLAWVMTSTALHKLLLHYAHRPAAQRAAWTKFLISRVGDAALVVATLMLFQEFGTLDFQQLFAAAKEVSGTSSTLVNTASFLLVVGAVTKSAQFPFHTWLPLTMETPTPVSALMHAGIVNAGGYLIIRTSPLVSLTPWALALLAVVGGFTAVFAAVVMLTQTSVKKKLAYSTIAQMGFMLLQCGLGAFSAAMLHILAHSLYKAHAFLNSGSVMQDRAATSGAAPATKPLTWRNMLIAFAVVIGFLELSFLLFGINPITKPGGVLLGGVLGLALTHWIGQVMQTGDRRLLTRTAIMAAGLCVVYVASFFAVDRMIADYVPEKIVPAVYWALVACLLIGFALVFALHVKLSATQHSQWLHRWYVHTSNGFYVDNFIRRLSRTVAAARKKMSSAFG